MKKEIQQILEIVSEEKSLNADRYHELKTGLQELKTGMLGFKTDLQEFKTDLQVVKTGQESSKDSWHQLRKSFTEAQLFADQRYYELKTSIEDISSKMATKDQLNQVFESLSQDITFMFGDHHRLKKRVSHLEKRVGKLEEDLP